MQKRTACRASEQCGSHQRMLTSLPVHDCASNAIFDTEGDVGNNFKPNIRMMNNSLNPGSQQIHMETQVKIGIRNVGAVFDIFHIPHFAIDCVSDPAECSGETPQLAVSIIHYLVWYSSYENDAMFDELGEGM